MREPGTPRIRVILPADFPPSSAPRESCNYGDPVPFTVPPATPEATRGFAHHPRFAPVSVQTTRDRIVSLLLARRPPAFRPRYIIPTVVHQL